MRKLLLSLTLTAIGSCAAWAGTVCPGPSGANPFPHVPDPSGTGCNVLITINANQTVTVSVPDSTPYELSEDVLVGVKNNSSVSITSLGLTGSGVFGLEGDGICIYTFVGSSYCSANGASGGTDPYDYYGPTSTFAITNANTGTVNFNPGIAPGGVSYFSLEGQPDVTLNVIISGTGPGGTTPGPTGAPTLSAWATALLGLGLMGYAMRVISRNRQNQE